MAAEIGRFALMLAFMIALAQAILPMLGAQRRDTRLMVFGDTAAAAQFAFVALSFGCLVYSFLISDFSLEVVAANSHTAKPMIYKFSGAWGNHEGSMMLWVLRDNTPARKFYEALGGQILCEKPIEIGTQTLIEVAYGWKDLQRLAGN